MSTIERALTLNSLQQLALPLGTAVVSGEPNMGRPVRWLAVASGAGALPFLEGGELLLVAPSPVAETWVRAAANAGIAGLLMTEPLAPLPLSAAQMLGLPVLQLPAGSRLREIERAVMAVLLSDSANAKVRSLDIYDQLMRLASDTTDLTAIIQEVARLTQKAVVVQDKRLHIREYSVPPVLSGVFDHIRAGLEDRDLLPASFQDRHKLPMATTPTQLHALGSDDLSRLITPIVTQGIGRGYLSFIAHEFTDLDSLVVQHAAVICALEMARAKAISEVEKRLRGDFLDGLLLGSMNEGEAVAEGERYGHEMSVPHVALVVRWQGAANQHPSIRRLETLVNGLALRRPGVFLSRLRESEVRLFVKAEGPNPIQAMRELAGELLRDSRAEYPDARLAVGIGQVAARVNGWRGSYKDATQAADLAQKLRAETSLFIGDLGIYMFLSKPDYRDDLIALRDSTIGNLIGIEERQRADLLATLNAFFEAHGNHTATADALSVHRNTLSYRMARIAEITGLDLNQPDVRLAVHLALKIHKLLGSES